MDRLCSAEDQTVLASKQVDLLLVRKGKEFLACERLISGVLVNNADLGGDRVGSLLDVASDHENIDSRLFAGGNGFSHARSLVSLITWEGPASLRNLRISGFAQI